MRRLAAAVRGASLYSPGHPLLARAINTLEAACRGVFAKTDTFVIGFLGDDVVVDGERLVQSRGALAGFVRDLRNRGIEKISLRRGLTHQQIADFVDAVHDTSIPTLTDEYLTRRGVRHVTLGQITVDETVEENAGIDAARKVYHQAVETAEKLWGAAKAGDQPDPGAARRIIDSLAKLVQQDRTSLMALTAIKQHDSYTFTHMINVSALAMAQARSLQMDGPLLREFGIVPRPVDFLM